MCSREHAGRFYKTFKMRDHIIARTRFFNSKFNEMEEKVKRSIGFLFILFMFWMTGFGLAATTGKITGVIRDADNKDPLPGVNVLLSGTSMGAASNVDGEYLVINVPPGTYTIRFSMMGYKKLVVENVRVNVDLTTALNAELVPTVLDAGEVITVTAERPLVQLDRTSAMAAVGTDEIENLPVQTMRDVLELQSGIIKGESGEIHIRGGRSGEVAYWVDGVAATDVFNGNSGLEVENASIQELQVISGTFNAEYGQAMSGIVNVVTKDGGADYHGRIKGWVGDYFSRDKIYDVSKRVIERIDPQTKESVGIAETVKPLQKFNPHYNAEASFSGPVPRTKNQLTFFTHGRWETNEGYQYGSDWFKPNGSPGDSSLVPLQPYERMSGQLKLAYRLTPDIKITYNGFVNRRHNDRMNWSHSFKYNPYGLPQRNVTGSSHIFVLNHLLTPRTFYYIRINRFDRHIEQYVHKDPTKMPKYLVRVADDSLDLVLDPDAEADLQRLSDLIKDGNAYRYFIDPTGPEGYVDPDSTIPPIGNSFNKGGQWLNHLERSSAYWIGKFDLTSQVNRHHEIKTGLEVRLHELSYDQFSIREKPKEGTLDDNKFIPYVYPVSSEWHDKYRRNPREFSAYVQDKMEFSSLIMNLGLRFDYFDANSAIPVDPQDPDIYNPVIAGRRYNNIPDSLAHHTYQTDWDDEYTQYTPEERRSFMHKNAGPKYQVSPRLGIAYPITDRGVIHFSYGHFFQMPEFRYLYAEPDFKLGQGSALKLLGNPDLRAQKTVMYEIGLQQQVAENFGIDATLFYRDIRDWVGTSPLIRTYSTARSYSFFENKDYSNVRGFTLKIERRYADGWFANIDYTYQVAEGTYSDPNDEFNSRRGNKEPRVSLIPLDWDQTHTLNASFSYRYQKYFFSIIGRYWTGRPYTPAIARGEKVGATTYSGLRENSARLPAVKNLDLLINRQFRFGSYNVDVFINIYNVFDLREEIRVYQDTGTADYTTNITPEVVEYSARRIGTLEDFVDRPDWYIAPRQIQLGMSIKF